MRDDSKKERATRLKKEKTEERRDKLTDKI